MKTNKIKEGIVFPKLTKKEDKRLQKEVYGKGGTCGTIDLDKTNKIKEEIEKEYLKDVFKGRVGLKLKFKKKDELDELITSGYKKCSVEGCKNIGEYQVLNQKKGNKKQTLWAIYCEEHKKLTKQKNVHPNNPFKVSQLKAELKGYQQATADFIKMIEKKIEERKEDKIRWELTDEDNVEKGHFKNPDFGIQVDARIFELEELKQMLVGK